eukprot:151607-Chlamydomonas_euryale.AAC.1
MEPLPAGAARRHVAPLVACEVALHCAAVAQAGGPPRLLAGLASLVVCASASWCMRCGLRAPCCAPAPNGAGAAPAVGACAEG